MNKKLHLILVTIVSLSLFISSCTNSDEDPPAPSYTLTQDDMNKSTESVEEDVTGRKYGEDVSIPHGGSKLTSEDTYRDIYSNQTSKSTDAESLGTIYTKRTYVKNADGSKGDLLVTFAMAKREAGYFTDGGDWEYVMMPNDGSNDYGDNPNGLLPPTSATDMRGQLPGCAGCHSQAGNDYLFSQGEVPEFKATQADLNAATNVEDSDITGNEYGEDVSIPHGGKDLTSDDTYRDVFSNIGMKEEIRVGAVLTKRTYMKNADGSKGNLLVTFAMIKREEGYYAEGGDFEYVMMPNDGSNDYTINPNGMLPEEGSEMRGRLQCAGCHSAVPGYSFIRGASL